MKTIHQLFKDTWEKKALRGWDYVYVMVDLHGVIVPSNFHRTDSFEFVSNHAKLGLQTLSKRSDVKLILWSSSHEVEINAIRKWLFDNNIHFDYINENPNEANTEYADFSKKPYFSILLDDKAGFEAIDWETVVTFFKWHI